MIKKVLVILFIFVFVFPVHALANDGGPMLDDDEYLSIDVKLDRKEAEIDGDFTFAVTLRNKSKDLIQLMNIVQIFKGDDVYENDTFKENVYNIKLQPGEKLKLKLKTIVPKTNIFYYQDNEYYTNLDFNIIYDLLPIDETKDFEQKYWLYENEIQSIPIKITNIYDGAKLINLEVIENETTFFFPECQSYESHQYSGELLTDLDNKLVITNMSDCLITDLYIKDLKGRSYNDKSVLSLNTGERIEVEMHNSHFISPEKLPETLPAIFRVSFKVDNKYYTTQVKKEYPSKVLNCPILDIALKDNKAIISSLSDIDINDLYIDLDRDNTYTFKYNEQYKIPLLAKDATVKIPYTGNKAIINGYIVGLIRDGKLYYWKVNNTDKTPYYFEGWDRNYIHISTITPTLAPTLTPTQTPAPTPTEEITPEPTTAIEVTNVAKESSMPLWVWVVLALAIVGAVSLIYVFRKKKNNDSK